MDREIYLADLDSGLFRANERAPKKLLMSLAVFIAMLIVSYGVTALLDSLAPNLSLTPLIFQLLIFFSFVFLCCRVISLSLRIRFNNIGMCSAVVRSGNSLTIMTLKSDFEAVADTYVGLMGLTYSNGFNTEDLLGYSILKNGANTGGKTQNAKIKLMQDVNFVSKYFDRRLTGIRYRDYHSCTLTGETKNELIFSAYTKKSNQVTFKLYKVYKNIDKIKSVNNL